VSEIYSPVSGEVIARNSELEGSAELINTDPYGEGWLFKVRPADSDATEGLLTAEAYTAITAQ
jgi:glycine cleavage system H protein